MKKVFLFLTVAFAGVFFSLFSCKKDSATTIVRTDTVLVAASDHSIMVLLTAKQWQYDSAYFNYPST